MSRSSLIPILAICGLAIGAAGCERREKVAATPSEATAPTAAEPTSLWLIEALEDGKSVSQLRLCADRNVQASFVRPAPEVNGKPCVMVNEPVETGDTYSVRCRIDDQLYRVGSAVEGDRDQDFTVDMAVTRQDRKGPTFEQVRRYRRLGECPAGWQIGDSAVPGGATITNTLTGAVRAGAGEAG